MTKSVKANTEGVTETPRAVVHKQILEVAEENPDSSLEWLAEQVSGANVDLVERVLERYGDPAEPLTVDDEGDRSDSDESLSVAEEGDRSDSDESLSVAEEGDRSDSDESLSVAEEGDRSDPDERLETSIEETMTMTKSSQGEYPTGQHQLTEKQLETLRTVREHPGATQAELAELLEVSSATINTRLNSIDGFDWERRHDFVEQVIEDPPDPTGSAEPSSGGGELDERLRSLEENVEQLRSELVDVGGSSNALDTDPELSHKILHACLASEHIDEEEELDIVREFVD